MHYPYHKRLWLLPSICVDVSAIVLLQNTRPTIAIILSSIHEMDQHENRHFGTAMHRESRLNVVIIGPIDRLNQLIGCELTAEYELTTIHSIELDLPEDDESSGIYTIDPDRVIIDGRVHLITEIDRTLLT